MRSRTVSIKLTDAQARLRDEVAEAQAMTPDQLLLNAVAHGLAMIAAGVDEPDLIEPWDRPGIPHLPPDGAGKFPKIDDTLAPF